MKARAPLSVVEVPINRAPAVMRHLLRASSLLLVSLTLTDSIRSYTAADVCDFFAIDGCVITSARSLDCRGDTGGGGANATVLNVTASALLANESLSSWPFPSDPPPADICDIVFNTTVTFLEYSSLSCSSSPFTCQLFLSAVGFDILVARGVTVSANTISIEARNLVLSSESKLTTTGYGLEFGALPGGNLGSGGNNAGSGGAQPCKSMPPLNAEGTVPTLDCCPMSAFVGFNDSDSGTGWAYPDADWNRAFGGGGSKNGDGSGGRSGGRLNVTLTGNLTIDGFLESVARTGTARATNSLLRTRIYPIHPIAPSLNDVYCPSPNRSDGGTGEITDNLVGSGSGGTVLIDAFAVSPSVANAGFISADGGLAYAGHSGGGGGRVVVRHTVLDVCVLS